MLWCIWIGVDIWNAVLHNHQHVSCTPDTTNLTMDKITTISFGHILTHKVNQTEDEHRRHTMQEKIKLGYQNMWMRAVIHADLWLAGLVFFPASWPDPYLINNQKIALSTKTCTCGCPKHDCHTPNVCVSANGGTVEIVILRNQIHSNWCLPSYVLSQFKPVLMFVSVQM